MNNHGGSRKGSGKKTEFEKPMKRTEVTLDEETINFYLAVGDGNLSKGIRQYWRGLTKPAPDACPECAGSGKTGSIGLPRECPYCDGTGKRR